MRRHDSDLTSKQPPPFFQEVLDRIREKIDGHVARKGSDAGIDLLDAGCGECPLDYKSLWGEKINAFGVDLRENKARRQSALPSFVLADAERLPLKDASFDIVVSMWVMEHLLRPRDAINEMLRVLKPGGLMLLATPNPRSINGVISQYSPAILERAIRRFIKSTYTDPARYSFRSLSELEAEVGRAGCEDIEAGYFELNYLRFEPAGILYWLFYFYARLLSSRRREKIRSLCLLSGRKPELQ